MNMDDQGGIVQKLTKIQSLREKIILQLCVNCKKYEAQHGIAPV